MAPESCVIHISSGGRDFRIGLETVAWTLNVLIHSVTPPYQNINIKYPARVQYPSLLLHTGQAPMVAPMCWQFIIFCHVYTKFIILCHVYKKFSFSPVLRPCSVCPIILLGARASRLYFLRLLIAFSCCRRLPLGWEKWAERKTGQQIDNQQTVLRRQWYIRKESVRQL